MTHYMDEAEICDQVAIIDDGSIVVNDDPDTLKRKYTRDQAKVLLTQPELFQEALIHQNYTYDPQKNGSFTIQIDDIQKFLTFIHPFKEAIKSLQIKNGTLNDVFLAITGKEIREGGEE